MGDLEDSVQRHPAGNARKETIWDTAWAITKAMQIAREEERERIIKLLENENCKPNDHDYNGGCNCEVIALIKGENK